MAHATLIDARSLHRICADPDMPTVETAAKWLAHEKDFRRLYQLAHEFLQHEFEDELIEIADDASDDWVEKVGRGGKVVTVEDRRHLAICRLRLAVRCWVADQRWPDNPVKFSTPNKELAQ